MNDRMIYEHAADSALNDGWQPIAEEGNMDVLEPKEAFAEAQKVIERRGGMPKGKTVAFLWHFHVGRPVTLRYYKTPRTFQRSMNKEHQQPVISDADVAEMEQILRDGKKYVIVLGCFKDIIKAVGVPNKKVIMFDRVVLANLEDIITTFANLSTEASGLSQTP